MDLSSPPPLFSRITNNGGIVGGIENRDRHPPIGTHHIHTYVDARRPTRHREFFASVCASGPLRCRVNEAAPGGGLTFILREINGGKRGESGNTGKSFQVPFRLSLSLSLSVYLSIYLSISARTLSPAIDEFFNWQQSYEFSIWPCALMGH